MAGRLRPPNEEAAIIFIIKTIIRERPEWL
jgi:hypothetical protein